MEQTHTFDYRRQPVDPEQIVDMDREHKHLCDECGTCWKHSNDRAGDNIAHTCPTCGEEQWKKYWNSDEREIKDLLQAIILGSMRRSSSRGKERNVNV